jgi:hypothetical protein
VIASRRAALRLPVLFAADLPPDSETEKRARLREAREEEDSGCRREN